MMAILAPSFTPIFTPVFPPIVVPSIYFGLGSALVIFACIIRALVVVRKSAKRKHQAGNNR
jgi:uncharacterized protein (DUF2062 family)